MCFYSVKPAIEINSLNFQIKISNLKCYSSLFIFLLHVPQSTHDEVGNSSPAKNVPCLS